MTKKYKSDFGYLAKVIATFLIFLALCSIIQMILNHSGWLILFVILLFLIVVEQVWEKG
jgi:phage-related holin